MAQNKHSTQRMPHTRQSNQHYVHTHLSEPHHPTTGASAVSPGILRDEAARIALEVAPDAVIITDRSGAIMMVNQQTERLFGYTREELLGQSHNILLPSHLREIHTKHNENYHANPRTRLMGIGLSLAAVRKDGSQFPVEISLSPLMIDGQRYVVSVIRDVTERARLEEALRQSERAAAARAIQAEARMSLLQLVIDELPSGVFMIQGDDARLVLANKAVESVWGSTWQQGQPLIAFLQSRNIRFSNLNGSVMDYNELAAIRACRHGHYVSHLREIITRPDGTTLPVLANAVPIDPRLINELVDSGEHDFSGKGAVIVLQDVTPFIEAEHLKDEFIGVAAHELRNPVAALKGFADMLAVQTARGRGPALADWQTDAIESIEQATVRLVELTDDLLDVTRLQSGRITFHLGTHDIVMLLQRVITRFQLNNRRHEISLVADAPNILLQVDKLRTEQIFINLIDNAIKYSPEGGVVEVCIRLDDIPGNVVISIQDHGIGIPEEQQSKLFKRFSRADNATDHGISGTGLGLYLSRELVERQGGRIWFESVSDVGTTFYVALPIIMEDSME